MYCDTFGFCLRGLVKLWLVPSVAIAAAEVGVFVLVLILSLVASLSPVTLPMASVSTWYQVSLSPHSMR